MDTVRKTFDGTIDAILTENNPTETLVSAIAVVSKGYRLVPGPLGAPEKRADAASVPSPKIKVKSGGPLLSPRESAVLEKLRDGGSNKDIANALGICEATVKVYLRTCFKKIGAKNRTQAAVWASEQL
jgi:DNA-binding NarL/FixJ family response regulator